MEKEWRDYAFSHKQHFGRSADKNEIWSSFAKLIPSLLTAFAEEVIGHDKSIPEHMKNYKFHSIACEIGAENRLKARQRLKMKEIISSLEK